MNRPGDRLKGQVNSLVTREVELGETVPGEREGHVRETFTFYANRFSRRHFERNLEEVAGQIGVTYSAQVKAGLLLCDIEVTVEGEQDPVDRFRRYAVGLSAASDGDFGGGAGP